jgi:hypothetical protein
MEGSAMRSLGLIKSTACLQSNESLLDLRQYPLTRGAKNLGSILQKLLVQILTNFSSSSLMLGQNSKSFCAWQAFPLIGQNVEDSGL